ncbi:phage tail protein [Endozoicomonas gorgoniicola]|uniref:Phage tail protein n=1 Tax=Endozoicomonas gorgoniicola TaxID=1234144 RepID=A0ABT3MQZ6_9GAMM|nr:phage tail protein [Endozoicomonas gorgoniicola]MCW7551772.1 phage tail protein [Endozoicomonas gorgoniicola]
MKIDLELDSQIEDIVSAFRDSPRRVDKALTRALRKLSRFAERQTLRNLARQQGITQKLLKELGRVRVTLNQNGGYQLVIWIGVLDIPAHYLGKPVQTRSGVRTAKHFWPGAFLMQPLNASHPMVFKRKANWKHRYQRSKRSGRMMWMGLPLAKQGAPLYDSASQVIAALEPELLERFTTLLQQELNYAFNIEPR